MKIRKALPIAIYTMLDMVAVVAAFFWYLEVKHHSQFSDHACPIMALVLWWSVPTGLFLAWLIGRKQEWAGRTRAFFVTSQVILCSLWAMLSWAFLCLMGLR